ncbi:MAG TPA: hypothetical protein VF244_07990 [Acidimicrobiales bacterium]
MRIVRGAVAGLGFLVGGMLTVLVVWWSVGSIPMPECGTDPDNTVALTILQVGFVVLALAAVAVSVLVVVLYRRWPPRGGTVVALAYPALVVTTWVVVTGIFNGILGLTSATGPTGNCF